MAHLAQPAQLYTVTPTLALEPVTSSSSRAEQRAGLASWGGLTLEQDRWRPAGWACRLLGPGLACTTKKGHEEGTSIQSLLTPTECQNGHSSSVGAQ